MSLFICPPPTSPSNLTSCRRLHYTVKLLIRNDRLLFAKRCVVDTLHNCIVWVKFSSSRKRNFNRSTFAPRSFHWSVLFGSSGAGAALLPRLVHWLLIWSCAPYYTLNLCPGRSISVRDFIIVIPITSKWSSAAGAFRIIADPPYAVTLSFTDVDKDLNRAILSRHLINTIRKDNPRKSKALLGGNIINK